MGKRFTATEKWRDPWFRRLSVPAKLLWIYILDECDAAGVWKVDVELAGLLIGYTYPMDTVLDTFKDRIHIIDDGNKWFVSKFIEFQYGSLSKKSPPHLHVISLLTRHGINSKPYLKGIHTLKEEEEEKDKEKEEEKVKTPESFLKSHPEFAMLTASKHFSAVTAEQYSGVLQSHPRVPEKKAVSKAIAEAKIKGEALHAPAGFLRSIFNTMEQNGIKKKNFA